MGLATPGTGNLPCQRSAPDLASKPRREASMTPVKTRPPAVITTPLTNGMPHLKANPSGALSSVVPTADCQRIFPALRSTATNAPHGGLLHGIPRGDIATTRVIAKGAPSCGPNSTPGGGLKPSASAR